MNQWASNTLFSASLGKAREAEVREVHTLRPAPNRWDPEAFAREQIRGMVQQVFFSRGDAPVHQVVLSPLDELTDVSAICRLVGEQLAGEKVGNVAVVGRFPHVFSNETPDQPRLTTSTSVQGANLREVATRLGTNLWLVPECQRDSDTSLATLVSYVRDVRRDFDYSVVAAATAASSQLAATIAQPADGIILVVAAGRTRRATATRIKQVLENAQVRILGAVLSDRVFPIPETMYRRL